MIENNSRSNVKQDTAMQELVSKFKLISIFNRVKGRSPLKSPPQGLPASARRCFRNKLNLTIIIGILILVAGCASEINYHFQTGGKKVNTGLRRSANLLHRRKIQPHGGIIRDRQCDNKKLFLCTMGKV